jgi:hypothetical protein
MVYEKRSTDATKPNWERNLEANAEHNVHDTSTLVGKDTEKVRGVWEDKAQRDNGRVPHTEEKSNSFWSHLFGQAEEKAQQVEDTLEQEASGAWQDLKHKASDTQDTLSDKAHQLYNSASEAAYDASDKLKQETDNAAAGLEQVHRDASKKGAELKHDRFESNNKTWYEKGTEDVKSRFGSIKSEANRDMEWAGQKVQDGISEAKDEINRVFNGQQSNNMSGHVMRGEKYAEEEFGQLRSTLAHTKLKPAGLIVQNARGKEM